MARRAGRPRFGKGIANLLAFGEATVVMWEKDHVTPRASAKVARRMEVDVCAPGLVAWPGGSWGTDPKVVIVVEEMSDHAARMLRLQLQALDIWEEDYAVIMLHDTSELGLRAVRPAVIEALGALGTRHVLLLGSSACRLFRRDLSIKELKGKLLLWRDEFYVWCMESPAAVLRAKANGTPFDAEWREGLLAFVEHMLADDRPSEVLRNRCASCDDGAWGWDRDGVPGCQKHGPKIGRGREATRKGWHEEIEGQMGMGLTIEGEA